MTIFGAILAGGASRRFGSNKAEAGLQGLPLVERVRRTLSQRCDAVALGGASAPPDWRGPLLADAPGAFPGPLAGILSALRWAQENGADRLVTAPCDTPLLPADYVSRLVDAADAAGASVACAASQNGLHPLCAVWRTNLAETLAGELELSHPPVHDLLQRLGAVTVSFPEDQLLNINTVDDLRRAQDLLGGA